MLGWGSLIAAAGVSFYYAKKTINERRALQEVKGQRPSEKLDCACTFGLWTAAVVLNRLD